MSSVVLSLCRCRTKAAKSSIDTREVRCVQRAAERSELPEFYVDKGVILSVDKQ